MTHNWKDTNTGRAARLWWQGLHGNDARGHKGDRAALARLRRVGSVVEALLEPEVLVLTRQVAQANGWRIGPQAPWITPTAVTAVTLAFLDNDGKRPLAEVLGQTPAKDGPARYSGLRFTRLIRAESDAERLTQLGRAARRLRADGVGINIGRLASDIYRLWYDPDAVRRDWTFQFHQLTSFAPEAEVHQEKEIAQ